MITRFKLQSRIWGSRYQLLWVTPIALLLVAVLGYWSNATIQEGVKRQRYEDLSALLSASVESLSRWFQSQHEVVVAVASAPRFIENIEQLLKISSDSSETERLRTHPSQPGLRGQLNLVLQGTHFDDYLVANHEGRVIAAMNDEILGRSVRNVIPTLPTNSTPEFPLALGPYRTDSGSIRLGITARIRHAGQVLGTLVLFCDPTIAFQTILSAARSGETGETYAFNAVGTMLSPSRFEKLLREKGVLVPEATSTMLRLRLKDPGIDLSQVDETVADLSNAPLTLGVKRALDTKRSGQSMGGYRNYRGSTVVGVWTWLDQFALGVVTEQELPEAFASFRYLRTSAVVLLGALTLVLAGLLGLGHIAATFHRRTREAENLAERLGQYTLIKRLGAGGMGEVYLGTHQMLKRKTAVKLLRTDQERDPEALARFEREVRLTSQLTHPNTIAIYDYGSTSDGIFYYAMELLDGMDLERIVEVHGPLGTARTIHVLLQACGSLHEAHTVGLVHRDVKPANIFLCSRGGIQDTVKVLDFGLVKQTKSDATKLTAANALVGTPAFLAPEVALKPITAGATSDVYSLGATGYFLLTGRLPFEEIDVLPMITAHISKAPLPPTSYNPNIPEDLATIILRCLEKNPTARFSSMEDLAEALSVCSDAGKWTPRLAKEWWALHVSAPETSSANVRGEEFNQATTEPLPRLAKLA